MDPDVSLGGALNIGEVADFTRVGSGVCGLHVADGDGCVHVDSHFRKDFQPVLEMLTNHVIS